MFSAKHSLTKRDSFTVQCGFLSFRPYCLLFEELHFAVFQMCSKIPMQKYQKIKTTLFSLFRKHDKRTVICLCLLEKYFKGAIPGLRQNLVNRNF